MTTFAWQAHDNLVASCNLKSEDLLHAITCAVNRVIRLSSTGKHHDAVAKVYENLDDYQKFAHRTQRLYDNFQRSRMRSQHRVRTDSPFDTICAEHSPYAWILKMEGAIPIWPRKPDYVVPDGTHVSPLRAL